MSLNIFAMATDKVAEIKGVERDWNGAKVIVARSGNVEYQAYISTEYEKCRAAIEVGNKHSDEVAEEITREAFIRFILVGWSGFVDPKGKEFKYTLKNARQIYGLVGDLVRDVRTMSLEGEQYRVKSLEKDAEALKK